MGLSQLFAWQTASAALTLAAIVLGVRLQNLPLTVTAAAMYALVAIIVGWRINQAFRNLASERVTPDAAPIAARRNARLLSLSYAWGGLTMLASYYLTQLHWQHAWQYGAAMLLIAFSLYAYSTALGDPASPVRAPRWLIATQRLTQVQGLAALAGILFILVSGKLTAGKSDWAANVVFVAGGITIAALSLLAVLTQRRLLHAARAPHHPAQTTKI